MIAFSCASLYSQPTTRSLHMEEERGTLFFCHLICLAGGILARPVLAQGKISWLYLLELNLFVILIYKTQKSLREAGN